MQKNHFKVFNVLSRKATKFNSLEKSPLTPSSTSPLPQTTHPAAAQP